MSQTWNSTSTSSSRSSQRCELDESDKSDVLVYHYRGGQRGVEIGSQCNLSKLLDQDANLRVSRKKIPRGNSRVEVRTEDLFNEPDRTEYQKYPTMKSSIASVGLPSSVYWKRLLFNQYPDLYIVSPASSAENSTNNSPESSQHCSRSSTFPHDERPGVESHEQL